MNGTESGDSELLPSDSVTVRQALELPSLRSGAPEVVAGEAGLDKQIRWVHVAEARDIANVVRGGELLISEGGLFKGQTVDDRRLIAELAERQIAALVIELGTVFSSIPRHLIEECRECGVTLIALHLPVPFIEVTEAIHTQIVNHRITLLNAAEQLQIRLTNLVLEGGGMPDLLPVIAEAVGNPVVYEREGGGFAYTAYDSVGEREFAAAWESFNRSLEGAPEALEVPLIIAGTRHGRLVSLGLQRLFREADKVALERAAGIAALEVMRENNDHSSARTHRRFLTSLLHGEIAPFVAEQRAAASGFSAAILMPGAVRRALHHRARPSAVEDRLWHQLWDDVISELQTRHAVVMVDPGTSAEPTLVMLGLDEVANRAKVARRFTDIVRDVALRHLGDADGAVICLGPAVHTWQAAVEGLEISLDAMDGALQCPPKPWHDATDLDLDRLLWSLRGNPDLERFARLRLENLVKHDRQRRTQLVKTLQVLLEQNGQKAETARALHLERQSLYNRVERIESLLGVDLADPDVRLGLHLALRVLRHLPHGVEGP